MDFRAAKKAKSIPGTPAAVHGPPSTPEVEQADGLSRPHPGWRSLSSHCTLGSGVSTGQGECPAHVAGTLGGSNTVPPWKRFVHRDPPTHHVLLSPRRLRVPAAFPGLRCGSWRYRRMWLCRRSPAHLTLSAHQSLIQAPLIPPLFTPRHWGHPLCDRPCTR